MTRNSSTADSRPKATLFCPDCGHESRSDGDWVRVDRAEHVHYLCPDCDTDITVRPAPDTESETSFGLWGAWVDSVPRVARRVARLATAPLLVAMLTGWNGGHDGCKRDSRGE
jgi:predicted RNA-binding Zn-ribbon protein involved in translation (DUF1610 family)